MFDCCGKTMFGFTVFSNVLLDGDVFCDSEMNLQNLLIWIFFKIENRCGDMIGCNSEYNNGSNDLVCEKIII